jgi:hypothetical protein
MVEFLGTAAGAHVIAGQVKFDCSNELTVDISLPFIIKGFILVFQYL